MLITRALKAFNLTRAWWMNFIRYTTPFVRFIPTDRCNLNCRYCFQKSDDSREMTLREFRAYLDKAKRLKIGLASFLGGEPLIWPHIYDAVAYCTERHVFSDLTTNGTLLNPKSISALAGAGLDYLNVSVDGSESCDVSAKNSILRASRLDALLEARRTHGMNVRINSVLYKDNTQDIRHLVEFSHRHAIPISIGFIVPHLRPSADGHPDIYFGPGDKELLDDITGYLIERKTSGYPIIDTREYFRNIHRFLRGEKFWECNYQRRFGWINVTPSGRIRSCTKRMDELDVRFLDLSPRKIRELRSVFKAKLVQCNPGCYSNCAYNGYHFFRNARRIFLRYVTGFGREA